MKGGLFFVSWILNLWPRTLLFWVTDRLGDFFFSVVRFRRGQVLRNLELAYGEKTETERLRMARENYRHYGRVLMQIVLSLTWSSRDYDRYTRVEGWHELNGLMNQGQGGFILTSHLGNWELAIQSASRRGLPIDVVVKKPRSPAAKKFLNWYRTRYGGGVLYEEGTARDILRSCNKGRFAVFVLDQFMGPPIGLPVQFFGKLAGTAAGLALLTEKRSVPLITAYNYTDKSGINYTVFQHVKEQPLFADDKSTRLYQKTQFYNDLLESTIRKHPEQWLWLHRRWKAFKGEPRWKLIPAMAALFLILGCAGSSPAKPTGIELPPDPNIAVPEFTHEDSTENKVLSESAVTSAKIPEALPEGKQAKAGKKKAELKNEAKPQTVNAPKSVFDVVPVDKVPFEVGERMEIDLTYMAIPAGRATLEVREGPAMNGRPTYHLWGNVLSSKIVDTFYHVDNTIESFIDKEGFIPYKFLLSMFETHQKKETRVSFDHPHLKAYYWAKRISQKWGDQDIDRVDTILPQARDMFSALYYARALNYTLGQRQGYAVYENGQNIMVEALPVAHEMVRSGAGVFQCWKIKAEVKINNVLKPTGDLYMWLSDDSKKYIVRFDAKVKIGSLYGNLVSVRER